jgi:hypothetical protein
MDDAEVNGADLVLLVVQDADGLRLAGAVDHELFSKFPHAPRPDGIRARVDDLDVTPDPDRGLPTEANLRLRLEATEGEDAAFGEHERVRDDLLEVRVPLRAVALKEETPIADAAEEGALEILTAEESKPLDRARIFEKFAPF